MTEKRSEGRERICLNCGEPQAHFGQKCPYTKLPCVICGQPTIYACSDCQIDKHETVHVCAKIDCQEKHEAIHKVGERTNG